MRRAPKLAVLVALALGLGTLFSPAASGQAADDFECAQGGGAEDPREAARFLEDYFADAVAQPGFQPAEHLAGIVDGRAAALGRIHRGGDGDGGIGAGRGGSLLSGGDGGCGPDRIRPVVRATPRPTDRPVVVRERDRRLPVTGSLVHQFALIGGVFLLLGSSFVLGPQIASGGVSSVVGMFRPRRRIHAMGLGPMASAINAARADGNESPEPGSVGSRLYRQGASEAVSTLQEQVELAWTDSSGAGP